jgi:hypothetical protein
MGGISVDPKLMGFDDAKMFPVLSGMTAAFGEGNKNNVKAATALYLEKFHGCS